MPKETDSKKDNGIRPEHWHRFNSHNGFGTIIDRDNKLTDRTFNEVFGERKLVNTIQETFMGKVEFSSSTGYGLDIFAEELGLDFFYNDDGLLTSLDVDLFNFCDNLEDEFDDDENFDPEKDDLTGMSYCEDGDRVSLRDLVETVMMEDDSQLTVYFDFINNQVEIVKTNNEAGDATVIYSNDDEDIFMSNNPTLVKYGDYNLYLGFNLFEDVFSFGVYVTLDGEEFSPEMLKMTTRVLSDCNYKTFLDSKSKNKYESLMKRIFLQKP